MFEGFTQTDIETSGGARIRLKHGGSGPPLLLLHGNPLSHVSWHKIANRLAEHFHVVAADLRGYGDSSAPPTDERHAPYSFRAMAQDQVEVMEALGHKTFMVAGHDRGARTAHRMSLDHPERIQRAAFVDILPSYHVWTHTSKAWATNSWHWTFMIQPYDFPERMMAAVPAEWYMEKKLGKKGIGLAPFTKEAFAEYVRCFTWKTIHASCEDYRACATIDFELDEADYKAGNKVKCPTLVVWGAESHTGKVYKDVLDIWRDRIAGEVTGGPIACGHYVPEHAPDELFDRFMRFFKG